jgi:uncharacterized protein (DUF697 family)
VASSRLPVSPAALQGLLDEIRASSRDEGVLVVAGARELVAVLRRDLVRGGVAGATREHGSLDGALAVVYVLAGEADDDDRQALREAERRRVPVVCVVTGPAGIHAPDPPYVLATNVIRVSPGSGFPLEEIAGALARSLGERATPLAARLPVLRGAVSRELIRRIARQNGLIAGTTVVPGADMPVLTLNQIRLVLRIADAHGFEVDRERIPEILGVVGGGFGLRALARRSLGAVPLAGWAVKGGIAYAGTRALGEAALRYFERRAPVTRIAGGRLRFPR